MKTSISFSLVVFALSLLFTVCEEESITTPQPENNTPSELEAALTGEQVSVYTDFMIKAHQHLKVLFAGELACEAS